LFGAASLI